MLRCRWGIATVLVLTVLSASACADVWMPSVFSDNMVIQQGMAVPVWGTAKPGERVTVSICDTSVSGVADVKSTPGEPWRPGRRSA